MHVCIHQCNACVVQQWSLVEGKNHPTVVWRKSETVLEEGEIQILVDQYTNTHFKHCILYLFLLSLCTGAEITSEQGEIQIHVHQYTDTHFKYCILYLFLQSLFTGAAIARGEKFRYLYTNTQHTLHTVSCIFFSCHLYS